MHRHPKFLLTRGGGTRPPVLLTRSTKLQRLHMGRWLFFSLRGENISILLQIIVNLLQPPAKACRNPSQNQLHKNDTFSATFSELPLEPFFFLHALLIKLACHTLLLENNADLSPRLQRASLVQGFRKSSQNTQQLLRASPRLCMGMHGEPGSPAGAAGGFKDHSHIAKPRVAPTMRKAGQVMLLLPPPLSLGPALHRPINHKLQHL